MPVIIPKLGFVDDNLIGVELVRAQAFQPVHKVQQIRHRLDEGNFFPLVLPVLSDVIARITVNDLDAGYHSDAHILQQPQLQIPAGCQLCVIRAQNRLTPKQRCIPVKQLPAAILQGHGAFAVRGERIHRLCQVPKGIIEMDERNVADKVCDFLRAVLTPKSQVDADIGDGIDQLINGTVLFCFIAVSV